MEQRAIDTDDSPCMAGDAGSSFVVKPPLVGRVAQGSHAEFTFRGRECVNRQGVNPVQKQSG